MYSYVVRRRMPPCCRACVTRPGLLAGVLAVMLVSPSAAQTPAAPAPAEGHEHHAAPAAQHEQHSAHDPGAASQSAQEGSGTSWLPANTPMYALHHQAGDWTLMGHGRLFVQYLHDQGERGREQTGSINWFMGMASRSAGAGRLTFSGMLSLEPWTIGGCGYPDLLASGERCNDQAIHDEQHPHDLVLELAAAYEHPVGDRLHVTIYAGPVGEPALGPPAFMHRVSALSNPLAPVTHHWFDSTHITYGVVTGGVSGARWKLEASIFNGREPDEHRTDFDFGALDSWSGRLWFLPSREWALQLSGGRLKEAEAGHDGEPPTDIDRITASATYHRGTAASLLWATTIGWGRNAERGGDATMALLGETSITRRDRQSWYGRVEWGERTGHDLDVPGEGVFSVAKFQGGYTHHFGAWRGLRPGIGGEVTAGVVPEELGTTYGGRVNAGLGLYVMLRPAAAGSN